MKEQEFVMKGQELEDFLKKEFSFNDSLGINLKEELDGISHEVSLSMNRGGLTDEQFNRSLRSYRKLAKRRGYTMKVVSHLPNEARTRDGYYINERKVYDLVFNKKFWKLFRWLRGL